MYITETKVTLRFVIPCKKEQEFEVAGHIVIRGMEFYVYIDSFYSSDSSFEYEVNSWIGEDLKENGRFLYCFEKYPSENDIVNTFTYRINKETKGN